MMRAAKFLLLLSLWLETKANSYNNVKPVTSRISVDRRYNVAETLPAKIKKFFNVNMSAVPENLNELLDQQLVNSSKCGKKIFNGKI